MHDCLIIGAGPAGLAVANTLVHNGVECVIADKGPIAHHISQYPAFMQFFSTRDLLEIDRFPLTITEDKPTRRQYLAYLARFAEDRGLKVLTYTTVEKVERQPSGSFNITLRRMGHEARVEQARTVVVACGAWDNPRRLGVPGEELAKCAHHFSEPHPYVGSRVLVVGGRNSAVETALTLYRSGADVSLSYRRGNFEGYGLKYWLKPDIENRIKNDEIHGYLGTNVVRIDWDTVTLRRADGSEFNIENDFVIFQLGFDPPVEFLRSMGIDVQQGTNIPTHDKETLETNVPGLFVAGTIIAGNVSGHVFIENSRHHGEMILEGLRKHLQTRKPVGTEGR